MQLDQNYTTFEKHSHFYSKKKERIRFLTRKICFTANFWRLCTENIMFR
jgi:hypothetical protein